MTPVEKSSARNREHDKIMKLFDAVPEISSSHVCKVLNVSKATAVSVLSRLIKDALIEKIGRGPSTRYILK